MKNIITIILLFLLKNTISVQMLTANAGIALNYSNDFNYRIAYTYQLYKRFGVGLGVHCVGYQDNFFSSYQTNNGLQYKVGENNPVLLQDILKMPCKSSSINFG
jgi:hypothetical protein